MTIVHKNHGKTSPHIALRASYLRFSSLLQLYAPSYLMAPRKSGVSRKVRIAGPYARPQEETPSGPNASTSSVASPAHVLSLAQVAAARETAHSKYTTQLQSPYFFLCVQQLFYSMCLELSHENRDALAEMHDTPIPEEVVDDVQGIDGNSGEDWEPVTDFLDNDEAFMEAMRDTFEHTYVACCVLVP